MKSLIRCLVILTLPLSCAVCCFSQDTGSQVEHKSQGGITTLYALDPLSQSFCFRDAGSGLTFQQHETRNRCSDINFNSYLAEHFAVGIEGARVGSIVDVGTASDLQAQYGYQETVGSGQGFASMRLERGRVMILKDRRAGVMQELNESAKLFSQPASAAKAAVKLGHIYLARIIDRHDSRLQVLVKLLVVGYVPGESVTFRWQSL